MSLAQPIYQDFQIRPRNPDLFDVDQAADYLHLRPSTVRDWILRRRIEHLKLGRRVFLKRSTLDSLLAAAVIPAEKE